MTAGFAKHFKHELHLKGAEKKRDGEKTSASPVSGGKVWSRRGRSGAKLDPNICIGVWRRGPRYQLLCLSHSLYRDELLPGCHHGVPPSPWKLRKHSISRGSRRAEADYYYYHCHGREFLFRRGCGTLGNPSVFKDRSVRMQHFKCVCLFVFFTTTSQLRWPWTCSRAPRRCCCRCNPGGAEEVETPEEVQTGGAKSSTRLS